jgi:periplasmic protein TonB
MFENTMMIDTGDRRPWTVLAGLSGQLLALGFAMIVPLIYTDQRPGFRFTELHILPPVGRAAPPPDQAPAPPRQPSVKKQFTPPSNALAAPARTPDHPPLMLHDEQPKVFASYEGPYVDGAIPGPAGASRIGIPVHAANVAPPPAEPKRLAESPKPVERAAAPMRVGGDVQEAKIINRVIPPYPPLARQARVAGLVQLLGIISRDGRIQQLRVVSGHPLLVPAALDAVKQWTYRPTLLNGEPVEVVAPITVQFTLTH